jgi:hypothetical protein
MAKQGKSLPARRSSPALDDSLLIRSAESLGRMIGTLQRQLDGASKASNDNDGNFTGVFGLDGREDGQRGGRTMKAATKNSRAKTKRAGAAGKGGSASGATKVRSTADRSSKRASKAAVAKKSAGRGRSGAARKSAKSSRSR